MLNTKTLFVGFCICLFCSGARAQGGFNNYQEFSDWCRSQGGTPSSGAICTPNAAPAAPSSADPAVQAGSAIGSAIGNAIVNSIRNSAAAVQQANQQRALMQQQIDESNRIAKEKEAARLAEQQHNDDLQKQSALEHLQGTLKLSDPAPQARGLSLKGDLGDPSAKVPASPANPKNDPDVQRGIDVRNEQERQTKIQACVNQAEAKMNPTAAARQDNDIRLTCEHGVPYSMIRG